MNATLVDVGNRGREYVAESLRFGLSPSRAAMANLGGMQAAVAIVPQGAQEDGVLDFKHGGLGRSVISDLAELLVDQFAGSTLVVELPMRRVDDPEGPPDRFETITAGSEIFAVCTINKPASAVEDVLAGHDPTFLYNAFVVHGREFGSKSITSNFDPMTFDSNQMQVVIAGAYDGEGFVLLLESGAIPVR